MWMAGNKTGDASPIYNGTFAQPGGLTGSVAWYSPEENSTYIFGGITPLGTLLLYYFSFCYFLIFSHLLRNNKFLMETVSYKSHLAMARK